MATPNFDAKSAQSAELLEFCPVVPGATVSKPLLNLPEGRAVLFAMDAGQELSEHRAPFTAMVHVLDGELHFTVDGQERVMRANSWLVMPPNAPHALRATVASRFLLTLLKRS